MFHNTKTIERLINGEFEGIGLIWQMLKSDPFLTWGLVIGLLLIPLLFILFYLSIKTEFSSGIILILPIIALFIGVFLTVSIKDLIETSKYISYLELEKIESEYKEKNYLLSFSSEIKNVQIGSSKNVKVETSDGLLIFVERDKVTSKDIGKNLVLERTAYETEDMSIDFRENDYLTEVSVQ